MPATQKTSDSESGDGQATERAAEQDALLAALKQATIMMVDDEPVIVETLGNLLEDAGYKNFVSTTDSKKAVALMASKKPDIVLLDVMMPDVTGLDILESMGADEGLRHIPSIIITAATDSETKLKALELGATDVLNKPVDPSELALRVRNTLATKANQDRLMKFDPLTGLPNRRFFMGHFAKALARAKEKSTGFALLHINLDRFKKINETLGRPAGDEVLQRVAERLTSSMRTSDVAARIGNDEFMVMLSSVTRDHGPARAAQTLLEKLSEPYRVAERDCWVTASIGIA
ncbi:MAG: diguanylate cyclase, partial [Gammaproteobacteria bacterium]|nr:diguanylate cyclase [Gammaproteobacteria bacterium]